MTDDEAVALRLLAPARAVLFDFDGPVCNLFRGASTAGVAAEVKRKARRHWGVLDQYVEECHDSHGILRQLRTMYDRSRPKPCRRPLDLAERTIARQEREAVQSAESTPDLTTLVTLLDELGLRLVIVSNNAERPIRRYLKHHGMHGKFEKVFGRDPKNAGLMKPHPDCVHRALRHLSLDSSLCVLIGDQLTDLRAAEDARTPFIGYNPEQSRADQMRQAGAEAVFTSYDPLIAAGRQLLRARTESERSLSRVTR